jgi:hypothetical protein
MPKRFVYFARDSVTKLIKIGVTNDLDTRIGSFFTGNPRLELVRFVEVDDAMRIESYLHNALIKKRDLGEFFSITLEEADEQIAFVKQWLLDLPSSNEIEELRKLTELEPVRDPTNREMDLIDKLVAIRSEKASLELQEEVLEAQLIRSVGACSGIKGWINFKSNYTTRLDTSRLKEERPELFAAYAVTTSVRSFRLKPRTKN